MNEIKRDSDGLLRVNGLVHNASFMTLTGARSARDAAWQYAESQRIKYENAAREWREWVEIVQVMQEENHD